MSLTRSLQLIAALCGASTLGFADTEHFRWTGTVAPGQTIEIRGVNGSIKAEPASGGQIEVTAEKIGRRSNPRDVRVEVVPHAGGVTICAVYPDVDGKPNECKPGGGRSNTRDNDVAVNFIVRVPAGVKFAGRNVNGNVEVSRLQSDADVSTVNGGVKVHAAGVVQAKTVNGSIDVQMGTAPQRSLAFSTVNGGITVGMPNTVNATVNASTVNGRIQSDLPMTVSGNISPRKLQGTLGSGGPELKLSTVNGSIELQRSTL